MATLFPYGDLVGEIVAQGRFVEVLEPKLHAILRSLLRDVEVDEAWYLQEYGDVEAAVRKGAFASARDHYVVAGYFEDRFPRMIEVDDAWYRESYPDVDEAIRSGTFKNCQEHFNKNGFKEGRVPYPGWNLLGGKRE